jgi:hypothetical protein
MIHKALHKIQHHARRILHHIGPQGHRHRNVIAKFAEKTGLVYFGTVDQHRDDHEIVRGLTASSTHQDDHYCVGSVNGYDIHLVDRNDSTEDYDGVLQRHHLIIFQIKLHTTHAIHHFLMTPRGSKETQFASLFTTASSHLQSVPLGSIGEYTQDFLSRYELLSAPTHFIDTEILISSDVARSIAAHFWPLALEVWDNSLYIYSTDTNVTTHLLDTMIQNGLWLAGQIDKN